MGELKDWALGVASKLSKVTVTERQVGDVAVVALEGNIITGEAAGTVRGVVRRLLAEGRLKILPDMADVRWVDSTGLGELVSAVVAVTRAGGQIEFLKVRENIKHLLSVTKLDTVLAICDDESEAVNGFL